MRLAVPIHGAALLLALLTLLVAAPAQAKDGFESVRCGSDVPHALIGKRTSNEPVVEIERRHADLALKDLGGSEISDRLDSTSWSICGREYMVLSDTRGVVRDVLAFPQHSRVFPEFGPGACQVGGKPVSGVVVAVLDNQTASPGGASHYSAQDTTPLAAKAAWKIDEKAGRFEALSIQGLVCPRGEIITVDGGP